MAASGLGASYILTSKEVDSVVTKTSAGVYALGKRKKKAKKTVFTIEYVGRSDSDVNGRLKKHVGNYERFKFGYCESPKAAFEKECHLYHDFTPPDNKKHPDRPDGSKWKCPRCKVFD